MSEPGIEAQVAAHWWADQMRDRSFPDNGADPDDPTKSPMALGLIGLLQEKQTEGITAGMVDAYEAALARRIQAMLDEGQSGYGTALNLHCDYGPGEAHVEAFTEAGITPGMTVLPWKTTMWVQPGRVSVGAGYGSEPMDLPLELPPAQPDHPQP